MRKITKVTLRENRTSTGWPHCLEFQFAEGWPLIVELAPQSEYSQLADAVKSLNENLSR